MKSGKCPKCGGADIIEIPGLAGAYGNNVPIGITFFSSVKVTRYLCSHCGFSEEWIINSGDIEKIKKIS